MPKGVMIVQSRPASADREDEYNQWYSRVHIPEILAVPGFVAARRYRVVGPDGPVYIAVYDIEADDVTAPVKELGARSASGQHTMSDVLALDPPPVITIAEELS
jgi:hypothetical protein